MISEPGRRRRCRREALTLIELVSSMAASVVLLAGIAAAVGVSVRSIEYAPVVPSSSPLPGSGVGMLQDDLNDATNIVGISSDSITVAVPDRTGDGHDEEIAYTIDGDQLQRVENGGDAVVVASGLGDASFQAAGPPVVDDAKAYADPHDRCWVQDIRTVANDDEETRIEIPKPAGVMPGDLLLAAVGTTGKTNKSIAAAAGWTQLHVEKRGDYLTLGVWYRIADGTEEPTMIVTWSDDEDACGWMMRISGVDTGRPISASELTEGTAHSYFPMYRISGDLYLDRPNLLNLRFVFITNDALFDELMLMNGFSNLDWVEAPDDSSSIECGIAARHESEFMTGTTGGYYFLDDDGYYIACEVLVAPPGN